MIAPGALVTCRQTGAVLWVVKGPAPGGRYYLRGKRTNGKGTVFTSRVAGAGDLTLIKDPPTFAAGTEVRFNGGTAIVVEDHGDTVAITIPEHSARTRRGSVLRIAASRAETAKADIIVELLK